MTKRIFVTSTNTDIGKTYTSKLLLREFASRGIKVGVIKPIETGVIDIAPDGEELLKCVQELNLNFKDFSVEDIVPIRHKLPAAPYVASNATKLDMQKLESAINKIEKLCEVLIIEGAGGLYVPIDNEYMIIDLIKHLNAKALLVTHCSLGCINDTLLSRKALSDNKISFVTAFNCKGEDESFEVVSKPYFIKTELEILKVDKNIDTICDVLYNL